jgi:hypothetical protein
MKSKSDFSYCIEIMVNQLCRKVVPVIYLIQALSLCTPTISYETSSFGALDVNVFVMYFVNTPNPKLATDEENCGWKELEEERKISSRCATKHQRNVA